MLKRKHRRLILLLVAAAMLGAATLLVANAFRDSLLFFYSPSDLAALDRPPDRAFRIGGLVEEGSVKKEADGVTVRFVVTDLAHAQAVVYRGLLPDLFREGQGVVAEGRLDIEGVFVADTVLAKHDETYMPPEVAEALRKSGVWRGEEAPTP